MSHFRAWGVDDPESWANSQVNEGIDQYARLVFLRGAWQGVIADRDVAWIDAQIDAAANEPSAPGVGAGHALKRLLAAGASREDLADLVRAMQWETLFHIMEQIDDPDSVTYPTDELPRVGWVLARVDENAEQMGTIGGLHESVLQTDPTGREMRPRSIE